MSEPRAPYEPGPGAPPSPEPRALSAEQKAYLQAEAEVGARYFLAFIDALGFEPIWRALDAALREKEERDAGAEPGGYGISAS